jgi:hypothetical protein
MKRITPILVCILFAAPFASAQDSGQIHILLAEGKVIS